MRVALRRLVRIFVAVATLGMLLMAPTPAWAFGFSCKGTPTPDRPGSGLTSIFVQPPSTPVAAKDDVTADGVPRYAAYGLAGMTFNTYDLGCGPDLSRDPDAVIGTMLGNWGLQAASFGVAVTSAITSAAYQPTFLKVFDPLITNAVAALRVAIFNTWIALSLAVVGLLLLWRSSRMRMSHSARAIGWALLVMIAAVVIFDFPVRASSIADEAVSTTLGSVHAGITGDSEDTPADSVAQDLYYSVLWRQWKQGEFGSADSATAQRFAVPLFQAQALTWSQSAQYDKLVKSGQPSDALMQAKQKQFDAVAAQIKQADPAAYSYLQGNSSTNRIGAAIIAEIALLCVAPLLLVSAVLILAAYMILRLAVMMFPAIATVGVIDNLSGLVKTIASTVAAAVINCTVFGIGAAVNLLAIQVLLSPDSAIPEWLGLVMSALFAAVMWFALKPFRRLTQMVSPSHNVMQHTAGAIRGTASTAVGVGKAAVGTFLGTEAAAAAAASMGDEKSKSKPERAENYSAPVQTPVTSGEFASRAAAAPSPATITTTSTAHPTMDALPAAMSGSSATTRAEWPTNQELGTSAALGSGQSPVRTASDVGRVSPPARSLPASSSADVGPASTVRGLPAGSPAEGRTASVDPETTGGQRIYLPGDGPAPGGMPTVMEADFDDDGEPVYAIYRPGDASVESTV